MKEILETWSKNFEVKTCSKFRCNCEPYPADWPQESSPAIKNACGLEPQAIDYLSADQF
jgi:hypothetical protein